MYQYNRSNIDWIMVQTIEQVETVQVQPNSKAWIMVQNEPIFALRTADMMGLTTTEYYKFEKYNKAQSTGYVTHTQLTQAIDELKEVLNESINKLTETANKPTKSTGRKSDGADDESR